MSQSILMSHANGQGLARVFGTSLALLCLFSLTGATNAQRVHVFLVGGQSNADGRALISGLPPALRLPQTDVPTYWSTAPDWTGPPQNARYEALRPGFAYTTSAARFGPEVTFGRSMADYYAARGEHVALIKFAQGGTPLTDKWQAGGDATTAGDGEVYKNFQTIVNAGLAVIEAQYPIGGAAPAGVTIDGMIWMQGESDTGNDAAANAYESKLSNFITDVRATYGAKLSFVIGQLSEKQRLDPGRFDTVRSAQASVAGMLPNTGLVATDGFTLLDAVHFDASGQRDLGYAFAAEMQSLL